MPRVPVGASVPVSVVLIAVLSPRSGFALAIFAVIPVTVCFTVVTLVAASMVNAIAGTNGETL